MIENGIHPNTELVVALAAALESLTADICDRAGNLSRELYSPIITCNITKAAILKNKGLDHLFSEYHDEWMRDAGNIIKRPIISFVRNYNKDEEVEDQEEDKEDDEEYH